MESIKEIASWVIGSTIVTNIATLIVSKKLGKKKEDILMAIDAQKYFVDHIAAIKKISEDEKAALIKTHKEQVKAHNDQMSMMKKKFAEVNTKLDKVIAESKSKDTTIRKYEEHSTKLELIIQDERGRRVELEEELEKEKSRNKG